MTRLRQNEGLWSAMDSSKVSWAKNDLFLNEMRNIFCNAEIRCCTTATSCFKIKHKNLKMNQNSHTLQRLFFSPLLHCNDTKQPKTEKVNWHFVSSTCHKLSSHQLLKPALTWTVELVKFLSSYAAIFKVNLQDLQKRFWCCDQI